MSRTPLNLVQKVVTYNLEIMVLKGIKLEDFDNHYLRWTSQPLVKIAHLLDSCAYKPWNGHFWMMVQFHRSVLPAYLLRLSCTPVTHTHTQNTRDFMGTSVELSEGVHHELPWLLTQYWHQTANTQCMCSILIRISPKLTRKIRTSFPRPLVQLSSTQLFHCVRSLEFWHDQLPRSRLL